MKILILDIETSPMEAYVWNTKPNYIPVEMIKTPSQMLCFAAKWHGEPDYAVQWHGLIDETKEEMNQTIWNMMDEADAVVAYNARGFDIRHLNREFAELGWMDPSSYLVIDPLKTVQQRFLLPSNRLQYVARWLNLGSKEKTGGAELWLECMAGDQKAWRKMRRYNIQDVLLLDKVLTRLKPWTTNWPGTNHGCSKCGGTRLQKRGFYRTKRSRFQQYQCQNPACMGWSRSITPEPEKAQLVTIGSEH